MPTEISRPRRGLTAYGMLMITLGIVLALGLILLTLGIVYGAPPLWAEVLI